MGDIVLWPGAENGAARDEGIGGAAKFYFMISRNISDVFCLTR